VSSRNVEELVQLLKKEILKTQSESQGSSEETNKYRQLLVGTLHSICLKYPDVMASSNLMATLFELLTNADDETTAILVIVFTREYIQKNLNQKNLIVSRILDVFPTIRNVKVHRGLIWVLGEFCDEDETQILEAMAIIRAAIGDIPIVEAELKKLENGVDGEDSSTAPVAERQQNAAPNAAKLVTADGSYATQSALSVNTKSVDKSANVPPLRNHLLNGEFFIGTALANCLVKLALRYRQVVGAGKQTNSFLAQSMLILTSILHLGKSKLITQTINDDDFERIALCLMILTQISAPNGVNPEVEALVNTMFLSEMRSSLESMLTSSKSEAEEAKHAVKSRPNKCVESDDHLVFSQLMSKNSETIENQFDVSLSQAIAGNVGPTATTNLGQKSSVNVSDLLSSSKLSKVTQLTGFSDPVYAECYVNVNQYDICLDVLVVNQSSDTLQNCTLEFTTLGDLKLVEKPQPLVLAPHDFANIKASVKVASTENGIIFGNIVYDISGAGSDRNVVVLNDIHIDIMDYIIPATCNDSQFRQMWAEFEWENKVTVNTGLTDLQDYLNHLIQSTNMKCLTPQKALSGDCGFLAANLYAKSIFGEDALANVSIEKASSEAPVSGHIRIRAKSQGMALSLGDKVNASQKAAKPA
ncbi:unnamed protein product, partial [Medioppia subpectinata]